MSLLNWFSSGKKHADAESVMPSSGLSRLESTKPAHAANRGSHGSAQPANRKQERMERRELLYAVVRDAMVRAGVLSSSYKFKVLSLDTHGRQFLVMVDLALRRRRRHQPARRDRGDGRADRQGAPRHRGDGGVLARQRPCRGRGPRACAAAPADLAPGTAAAGDLAAGAAAG